MQRPFKVDIPQQKIDFILERVKSFPWYPAPTDEGNSWARGINSNYLQEFCDFWIHQYDWRQAEQDLNKFPQFITTIDGLDIHFIHLVGEAGGKRPLILTHGWPGSHHEFWSMIDQLANPSKYGMASADAFDVVVPSLPGYGFSGKPDRPMGQRATAALWNKLMVDVLGYGRYLAQGGDLGSLVTSFLGLDHKGCAGIHLNMISLQPENRNPQNDEEQVWLRNYQKVMQREGAYLQEHTTKPQTIAMGLMDSPVGVAAWILEKFHGWADLRSADLDRVFGKDQLLTNIMIYLVNDAIASSIWYYRGRMEEGAMALTNGKKVETPTAIANFLGEAAFQNPPQSWAERVFNIVQWTDIAQGGHFAAMEQPDLLLKDIQAFAQKIAY